MAAGSAGDAMNLPEPGGGAPVLYLLVFARCAGLLCLSPPLVWRPLPLPLRLGVAAVIALPVTALVGEAPPLLGSGAYVSLVVREAALGMILGLGLWLLVAAGQAAGQVAETGVYAPVEEEGPLAALLGLVVIVFFVQLGGLTWLVKTLQLSYAIAPLTAHYAGLPPGLAWLPALLFVSLAALAAPVVLATVLASWLVASVQRCLPGLQSAEVGPALRHLAVLTSLVVMAPLLGSFVLGELTRVATATGQLLAAAVQ